MIDITTRSKVESAVDNQNIASDTTTVGETIDRAGFEALDYLFNFEITEGAVEIKIYEGDESDMSDEAEVDSDDLLYKKPLSITATGTSVKQVGYIGNKRYTKSKLVTTGLSVDMDVSSIAFKSKARHSSTIA